MQEATLRVRINQIDHTLAQPNALDNSNLFRVPVIRIFGASSTGKKTCVHVHQVYPYFFVEYLGQLNPEKVNRYIEKLTHSLNHAIAVSLRRNPHSRKSQFIRAILLVKGVHFYGFHASNAPFLKVLIADPAYVSRAVMIMQSGTVMHTLFKTYENHLSYILQFMCDFNLYGCGWVDLGEVWQRGPESIGDEDQEQEQGATFNPSPYYRQTRMDLEVDVASHQVLNRHRLCARNLHHKLTIPAPALPSEPLVHSVRELWEDERQRRIAQGLSPSPELPALLSERSRGSGGHWVAEVRWWEAIINKIEMEKGEESIEPPKDWEKWVMTTFESVEALWESEWKVWMPAGTKSGSMEKNPYTPPDMSGSLRYRLGDQATDIDVNEAMLSSQEMDNLVDEQELEWERINMGHRTGPDEDVEVEDFPSDDAIPGPDDGSHPNLQEVEFESENVPMEEEVVGPRNEQTPEVQSKTPDPFKESPQKRKNPFSHAWLRAAGLREQSGSGDPMVLDSRSTHSPEASPRVKSRTQKPTSPPTKSSHSRTPQKANSPPEQLTLASSRTSLSTVKASNQPIGSYAQTFTLRIERHHDEQSSQEALYPLTPTRMVASQTSHGTIGDGDLRKAVNETRLPFYREEGPVSKKVKYKHTDIVRWTEPSPVTPSPASRTSKISAATPARGLPPASPTTGKPNAFVYCLEPPSASELLATAGDYGVPDKIYRNPYYSTESDAPENPREYAGLLYELKGGQGLGTLDAWDGEDVNQFFMRGQSDAVEPTATGGWEYGSNPPSVREIKKWLETKEGQPSSLKRLSARSQFDGPTQANIYGYKISPVTAPGVVRESHQMTVFSLEVFALSQGSRVADPENDEIVVAFYSYQGEDHISVDGNRTVGYKRRMIAVQSSELDLRRLRDFDIEVVSGELELINAIVDQINDLDPDIVTGWEVQSASWGYLNARAHQFGFDVGELISRAPSSQLGGGVDQWGQRHTSTFKVVGRHVLNVWRIMRSAQTLNVYSFENVAFHLLRRRIPRFSPATLTEWYKSSTPAQTSRLLRHLLDRTSLVLEMLDEAEVITQNAEFARVFGVDFFSVISRGSQFKVESFMFRIAKPESFVLISPSKQDVGKQNAAECIPLIMEPLSAFYSSPLVVLDFQSLYPSVMIAYNYCYSTCLGRVQDFQGRNKFGVGEVNYPPGLLETLKEHLFVAPNGMIYVKPEVRKGLLSKMLTELLDTRVMVKQAMKSAKGDKALRRILDARQLSLKFICNVTYGYTSASFSGRMPAVEIADSIVQSGRETLEKAIRAIDSTVKWGAKVVYGDTDSLFIYLRGKTKEQAFQIGNDIANAITALNPSPIKLKFEKVYLPCVLMAKKRYVGFKYENADDADPIFDAKGIETVRRDGVPAQAKMTETCLKILFRTQDLSEVKEYCCRSWLKLLEGKVSIQDFIFAKEVKMGTYSDKVPPPPGVAVAARRLLQDPNDEPQYGERIPYVIIRGEPNTRLVDRAVGPGELLDDRHKHLDAAYYISRVLIPPLERIFNLVGADVRSWYEEMPKTMRIDASDGTALPNKDDTSDSEVDRFTIDEHFRNHQCLICADLTPFGLCDRCRTTPSTTIAGLLSRVRKAETKLFEAHEICCTCSHTSAVEGVRCESLDCPWLYERKTAEDTVAGLSEIHELVAELEA